MSVRHGRPASDSPMDCNGHATPSCGSHAHCGRRCRASCGLRGHNAGPMWRRAPLSTRDHPPTRAPGMPRSASPSDARAAGRRPALRARSCSVSSMPRSPSGCAASQPRRPPTSHEERKTSPVNFTSRARHKIANTCTSVSRGSGFLQLVRRWPSRRRGAPPPSARGAAPVIAAYAAPASLSRSWRRGTFTRQSLRVRMCGHTRRTVTHLVYRHGARRSQSVYE